MRIPNLSVSENVTDTIRRLDRQRLELEQQISDGQKITLPEDDGMRMGRLIQLDTEKSTLSQYQRNASHATEYLNAGHLNLDKLREVSLRAQEIARVAGSGLTESATETYGFEVEQLIEEALNRVNSTHRKRALYGGTETSPQFGSTEVKPGVQVQKTISLKENSVGHYSPAGDYKPNDPDGMFKLSANDELVVLVNGRRYLLTSTADDLANKDAANALSSFINDDMGNLAPKETPQFKIEASGDLQAENRTSVKTNGNGELLFSGGNDGTYQLSAKYVTAYSPNFYMNESSRAKLDEESAKQFGGKRYELLDGDQQAQITDKVFGPRFERELDVLTHFAPRTSMIENVHPTKWKRLSRYEYGDLVNHEGKIWRSRSIESNFNHKPGETETTNWEEVPGGYDVAREDWKLTVAGSERREFWITPDGKLFDAGGSHTGTEDLEGYLALKTNDVLPEHLARRHAASLIQGQEILPPPATLNDKLDYLVKKITLSVARFNAEGSESEEGLVSFDPMTQEYYLSTPREDGTVISGSFFKGNFNVENSPGVDDSVKTVSAHAKGSVILRNGRYFLAMEGIRKGEEISEWSDLRETSPPSDTVRFNSKSGNSITENLILKKGNVLYAPETQKYYQANDDITLTGGSLGGVTAGDLDLHEKLTPISPPFRRGGKAFLLGSTLPKMGSEKTFVDERPISLKMGEYLYDTNDELFYVATENLNLDGKTKPRDLEGSGLETVPPHIVEQGTDWSFSRTYDKGQIVHFNGAYYQCLENGWDNSAEDVLADWNSKYVVFPSDEYFHDKETGQKVSNHAWLQLEKPLEHVLKFSVTQEDAPKVIFPPAGKGGTTAKAEAVVDADGYVAGLHLIDPGRYFSGTSKEGELLPPDFAYVKVVLADGTKMDASIIWEQDPVDPGPWKIAGFDFDPKSTLSGVPSSTQVGDSFSFATGSKTFLEHRDEKGNVVSLSYNGSEKNSEFYIGHNSKISSTLDAKNKGTEELGDVVSALVDLREAFRNVEPGGGYTEEVEAASQKLISLEEGVVDKMGELSSKMMRMEVVKSHDEDYFMELNERISRDLDVDLSEAIIRMMRASTAYQASLQVGAQLMNTSLLNYI